MPILCTSAISRFFERLIVFALAAVAICQSSDKFTEALVYARFAQEAWRCEPAGSLRDPVGTTKKWTLQAISTIKVFSTSDLERKKRALEFLDRQTVSLRGIEAWRTFQKSGPARVEAALSRGDLERAEALLPPGQPPVCDQRLYSVSEKVRSSRAEFKRLVKQGDELEPSMPAGAVEYYRKALSMNRRDKELQEKMSRLSRRD